jgi:hypothetical protein
MDVNKAVIGHESENYDTKCLTRRQTVCMVGDGRVFIAARNK